MPYAKQSVTPNPNRMKLVSLETAASYVKSGDRVFVQGAAMTPNRLINAICERYRELREVEIVSIHTDGEVFFARDPYRDSFRINTCFVGSNIREVVNTNRGDYIPIFLSDIHLLFRRNILPLDVAVVQVSPPDKHGYCSLGVSVDVTLPAVQSARRVIAQVNPMVPRTHGDGIVHVNQIDALVEVSEPIHLYPSGEISETEAQIGRHVASLIEDGATLQMGIGSIPNAVLGNLGGHKRLGIHTEMFTDGILALVESGVVTGEEKTLETNKIVTCFAAGSQSCCGCSSALKKTLFSMRPSRSAACGCSYQTRRQQ